MFYTSPTSHLYPIKTPLYLLGTNDFFLSYQPSGAHPTSSAEVSSPFLGPLDQNLRTPPVSSPTYMARFWTIGDIGAYLGLKNSGSTSPLLTSYICFAPSSGLQAHHHLTPLFSGESCESAGSGQCHVPGMHVHSLVVTHWFPNIRSK